MIVTPSIASPSKPTYSIPDVSQLSRRFPGRPWQFYEEGRKQLQKRPEKAEEDFHKARGLAVKENRKAAAPFVNLMGIDLGKCGLNEQALSFFDKALEIDPNYAPAWNNKGLALYKLGKNEEAIEEYQKALEIDKDYPEAHINLAVLLSVTNRNEEAEKEFKEALRLFEEKKPDRLEEAVKYLEKEIDAHSDNNSLWWAKGEFLKALGREAEARKSIERAEFYEAIKYYESNREELLRQYEGKFVAILHNKVIDSDEDWETLAERIIERFGARDMLVRKVAREPEIIHIPTPFLVH